MGCRHRLCILSSFCLDQACPKLDANTNLRLRAQECVKSEGVVSNNNFRTMVVIIRIGNNARQVGANTIVAPK